MTERAHQGPANITPQMSPHTVTAAQPSAERLGAARTPDTCTGHERAERQGGRTPGGPPRTALSHGHRDRGVWSARLDSQRPAVCAGSRSGPPCRFASCAHGDILPFCHQQAPRPPGRALPGPLRRAGQVDRGRGRLGASPQHEFGPELGTWRPIGRAGTVTATLLEGHVPFPRAKRTGVLGAIRTVPGGLDTLGNRRKRICSVKLGHARA